MRIIITRHGETEENKDGIAQGHLSGVLSDLGKEQVRKLAERLKYEKIDLIVSSDLARAADTAKAVAEFHPGVEVILDKRLREANIGSFQGKDKNELDFNSEEIEDRDKMRERVYDLVLELFKKYPDGTVFFIGHTGINKALISKLKGLGNEFFDGLKQKNTCLNIFEIDGDMNTREVLLNCTRHLDED